MTNLLIDESPQTYKPTLAAWIGLNEAIFLQQLHYILTTQDNVGKFADGRKWYRDKPKDFVVSYFPFWDESICKRTIANLRADALILVRSDLNKDPKDRSLWYTVHYQAIERLSGPVERILSKSVKRKEARKSRKSKPGSYPDYTKVQNVPNAKVQIVELVDESTKRTQGQVQNVLTPKDSMSKTPLTPNGVGKKLPGIETNQQGPRWQLRNEFVSLSGIPWPDNKSDSDYWWSRIGALFEIALRDVDIGKRLIRDSIDKLRAEQFTISDPGSLVKVARSLKATPKTKVSAF